MHRVIIPVFAIFGCLVGSEQLSYFSKLPKNITDVFIQGPVTLPCEITPSDERTFYYWQRDGEIIVNTTRRFQKGSSLHITRADRELDSGYFTCIAQAYGEQPITSYAIAFNFLWINDVTVQLQSPESASDIKPGSDVTLRCHLDASGDIRYDWFRNSDRLQNSSHVEIKKKHLRIKNANPGHNGVYKCIAHNLAGTKQSVENFILAIPGDQTPVIQVPPMNQLVKKGATAQFDCVYQHADVVEWYFKDSGPLETNQRLTVHSNRSLQISNATENDQGTYNCVGLRGESTEVPQSYTAELKLAELQQFSESNFEPVLPENKVRVVPELAEFEVTCLTPKSLPEAKRWWTNPSGHVISDKGETRVDDGRLIIDVVQLGDAGNYTCHAENIAGNTEMAFNLVVTTKPSISSHPDSVTVDENSSSFLTCSFKAHEKSKPFTVVRWRKDGKHINSEHGNKIQGVKIFKQNGTLFINSTKTSDRGEYICEVVTNGFEPVASRPATISVIEMLKFSPPPVNKKLELGTVSKVHCKAQGNPPPLVHWEKRSGDKILPPHVADINGTLHFNKVTTEDKGRYTCTAANTQGVINATINIEVVVAPKFSVLPKNPTEAIEGYSVMLDCVVEGDPTPTIHWDRATKINDFDPTRFQVLENGTLYISEVHLEDDSNYGCTAGSSAGLNRREVHLVVHTGEGYRPDGQEEPENEGAMITKAVLITMSVAGAYMILVIGLMVWCRYRRRSRKLPLNGDGAKIENGEVEHTEMKEAVNGTGPGPSRLANGVDSGHKDGQKSDGAETAHSQSSSQSKKSKSSYDKIALSRQHLKDLKPLGRGEFGDVLVAKLPKSVVDKRSSAGATTPNGTVSDKEVYVLVKSLMHTKDEAALAEFKRELDVFTKLNHENVTKLYGLCREAEPHYLVLEYTDWGDLKQFLCAQRKGSTPSLTTPQRISLIHQISKGMDHLSNARLVHRDLAARNCLISSSLQAKVGLPRLTRDPYSQEYCRFQNQIIPLRWLPHEAVYEDEYSTKSDVYAFGVVVQEIFSQGELPFPKMNDTSFQAKLKDKILEWKPHKSVPQELAFLQESCWNVNPAERPTFSHLSQEIAEILKSL